jgi:hypothetical protein
LTQSRTSGERCGLHVAHNFLIEPNFFDAPETRNQFCRRLRPFHGRHIPAKPQKSVRLSRTHFFSVSSTGPYPTMCPCAHRAVQLGSAPQPPRSALPLALRQFVDRAAALQTKRFFVHFGTIRYRASRRSCQHPLQAHSVRWCTRLFSLLDGSGETPRATCIAANSSRPLRTAGRRQGEARLI